MLRIILLLLIPIFSFTQEVTITVKDYNSKKLLYNAKILANNKVLATTNIDGKATFTNKYTKLHLIAPGYDTIELVLGVMDQIIYLSKSERKIREAHVKAKIDSFALRLIEKMKTNFKKNHPQSAPSYQFSIYSKFVIDILEDSLKKGKNAVDSEMNQYLKQNKLFVWEKLTEEKFDSRYGEKKTILNSNMSGFKEPIYELLALSMDGANFLPRIFRDKTSNEYNFRLEDSLLIDGRKTYEINFFHRKKFKSKKSRNGFVFIDSNSCALIKYYGNTSSGFSELNNEIIKNYCFTKYLYSKSNRGDMMGGAISFSPAPIIEYTLRIKDITLPKEFDKKEFRGNINDISLSLNDTKSYELLKMARGFDTLDRRESNTFKALDSIIQRDNVYTKIRLVLALTKGFIKYKTLNFSINDLIQHNRHEGLRFQIGGETNYELNKNIFVNGFLAFGFGDSKLKYGGGIRYILDHYLNSQLSLGLQSDVLPVGRNHNLYETPLEKINHITHLMFFQHYFKNTQASFGYQQDINKHLTQTTSIAIANITPLFSYNFQGKNLDNLNQVSLGTSLFFYPRTNYMTTPEGKFPVTKRPTEVRINYRFFHPFNYGINSYHTADFEFKSAIKNPIGKSEIQINGGYSSENTPLISLKEGMGASSQNHNLFETIGFGSNRHFATMQPSTFYSNYFASFFLLQKLSPIRLNEKKSWTPVLSYKALIGELFNPSLHSINLDAPNKLYQEAGLELKNIFTPIGIGVYYRFGAYQYAGFENNLAGRLIIGF